MVLTAKPDILKEMLRQFPALFLLIDIFKELSRTFAAMFLASRPHSLNETSDILSCVCGNKTLGHFPVIGEMINLGFFNNSFDHFHSVAQKTGVFNETSGYFQPRLREQNWVFLTGYHDISCCVCGDKSRYI